MTRGRERQVSVSMTIKLMTVDDSSGLSAIFKLEVERPYLMCQHEGDMITGTAQPSLCPRHRPSSCTIVQVHPLRHRAEALLVPIQGSGSGEC